MLRLIPSVFIMELDWSPMTDQNSVVYKHIKDSGHNDECQNVIILDREEQWYKRGIKKLEK